MMKRKFEIRNSKFETNPKYKGSKFQTKAVYRRGCCFLFWLFGFWSFEFVSDFVLRAFFLMEIRNGSFG